MSVWEPVLWAYFTHHFQTILKVWKDKGWQLKIREDSLKDVSILWVIPTTHKTGSAELRNFFADLLEFQEQIASPCKKLWLLAAGRRERTRLHLQLPKIPGPTCSEARVPRYFLLPAVSPGVKRASLQLPKRSPNDFWKEQHPYSLPRRWRRKNECPACVMASAVECFQRGTPKSYNRGSFDYLQNTKRRTLKLLQHS